MNRLWRYLCVLALVLASAPVLRAQNASKKNETIARLKEEIQFIDKELKAASTKHKESYNHLLLLQKKSASRKKLVAESDLAIKDLQGQIAGKDREIAALQAQIDTLEQYYSTLVYNTYKNRDNRVWFMYLLASENPGQGYRRFSYLKNLSQTMNTEAEEILAAKQQLAGEKEQLKQMYSEADALKRDREKEYKTLLTEEQNTRKVVNSLAKDKKRYQAELDRKRKEMDRLNKEVQRGIGKEIAKKDKIDYAVSGKFEQNKGNLPWPVKGVVTESFGKQTHPIYKNISLPANNGITITAKRGSEVKCVFEGVVKQIMIMPGYSHCVLVQHGEFFTFYCKLAKATVKSGQKVKAGDLLGTLEPVDDNTSQLHFQIWKGNAKQDPAKWLR
ncbi:MAG: peptidoglycan DD-metalloendopeptidase family protein [Bacteroidales bacterium]|nr:peptidoglycan DD-metalloendopeptidase family protein [Bacteroidales bacterium]